MLLIYLAPFMMHKISIILVKDRFKMKKIGLSLISMTLLLTGCVAVKPIAFPQKEQSRTLSISSEAISGMTEAANGDYFISDSQITVGDARNTTETLGSGSLGLLGFGIATILDKSGNASAISNSSLKQAIKFDQIVNEKLKAHLNSVKASENLKLLNNNQVADIKVVPYARISLKDKARMTTTFNLKAEFKNSADNNASSKRIYVFSNLHTAPLSEWDANNNQVFLKEANNAYDTLTHVLALDIEHQLNFNVQDDSRQSQCQALYPIKGMIYLGSPEHLCIGVFKSNKGQVFQNIVSVFKKPELASLATK